MKYNRLLDLLQHNAARGLLKPALSCLALPLLGIGTASAALPPGNLLANPTGELPPTEGWTIISGPPAESTGWGRSMDIGHDNSPGYFITSYSPNPCRRSQTIDLIARGGTAEALDAAPEITVKEWISCYKAFNNTGQDKYYIKVELRGANGELIASQGVGSETAMVDTPLNWTENTFVFNDYGPGVRYIYFEDGGWDGGGWAGQYGSYHDDASVSYSEDTDGDLIPDAVEDFYPFMDKTDPLDADEDGDSDGVSNYDEYIKGLKLDDKDTDDDGLEDGEEPEAGTNALKPDTDGDGLKDGEEVKTYHTFPTDADSDDDFFSDGEEIAKGTDPLNPASTPATYTVTVVPAPLGNDLTDPEGNGVPTGTGTNFNWSSISTSHLNMGTFDGAASEGAYSVFDNLTPGSTGSKWCCPSVSTAAPHNITVGFATLTRLTHFTLTSGNDAPERQPRVWAVQGSNDGTNFADIVRVDNGTSLWNNSNLKTLRFDLVKPSYPYRYFRFIVYAVNNGTAMQLDEIEYFGEQSNVDADNDGIPKLVEDYYSAFLSDSNPNDVDGDRDEDGATNAEEYFLGTKMDVADTDGDGMEDGDEISEGTLPLVADTDGDGLTDGNEFKTLHTDPKVMDSDGDGFGDGYEVSKSSDPALASSTPGGVVVTTLGTGTAALLGSDVTDHENNLNDTTPASTTGFDWVSTTSNGVNSFATEAALNVFDNKVGGGEAKWCCTPPTAATPLRLTVQLPYPIALTHFTLTSGDDAPDRDPRVWAIQGSNDGTTFTDIFVQDDNKMSFWGTSRLTVKKFQLPAAAPMYKWFRYEVRSTQPTATFPNGQMHQISEIEYFGVETDTDSDGIPDYWEAKYPGFLNPAVSDSGGDFDSDGLSALLEYQKGTRPDLADSDGDGISDGAEVTAGSDPLDMKLLSFTRTTTNLQFTLKVSDFSKRYKLRRSTTMLPDSWTDVGAVGNPLTDTLIFTDTTTANPQKAFYKIETIP